MLLVCAGVLVYFNSFSGVFLFDDTTEILGNPRLHTLAWPWAFLANNRRPMLYATLALNYALGQDQPFGYHLVNLCIHLAAGLCLFGVIRRTAALSCFSPAVRRDSSWIAGVTALLWLVHPLQTESVTYIIQRAESLAGMWYLFTLYAAIRYWAGRAPLWGVTAAAACLLGGLTKETVVTAPLAVLLYDRAFISGSFRAALSRGRGLYLGLAVTWGVMFFLLFTTAPEKTPTAGFGYHGITPWNYALTQPEVIVQYLKLSLWPHPLVFDYEWPAVTDLRAALPGVWVLVMAVLISIGAYVYRPAMGFPALLFFLILMPSSSFIPLKDPAFEHRMYLPLAAVLVLVVTALRSAGAWFPERISRRAVGGMAAALAVLTLGGLTVLRNDDYHDDLRMWQDVARKRPQNSRAFNNTGEALIKRGQAQDAAAYLARAMELNPDYPDVYVNMGTVFVLQGDLSRALSYFQKAIEISPDFAVAYNNAGAALSQLEHYGESVPYFLKALELDFKDTGVYLNLGVAMAQTGRPREAVFFLEEALRRDPANTQARDHLREIRARLAAEALEESQRNGKDQP